jgi:hypothetical protein
MSARAPEVAAGARIWRRRRLVTSIATAGMVAGAVFLGLFLGWVAAVGFACIAVPLLVFAWSITNSGGESSGGNDASRRDWHPDSWY